MKLFSFLILALVVMSLLSSCNTEASASSMSHINNQDSTPVTITFAEVSNQSSSTVKSYILMVDDVSFEVYLTSKGANYIKRPDLKSGKSYLGYPTGLFMDSKEIWASNKSWKHKKAKFYYWRVKDGKLSKVTVEKQ